MPAATAPFAPISVVIPTFQRPERLAETLRIISGCDPAPAEILVHVDAGDRNTRATLKDAFGQVGWLQSDRKVGPGGGRNALVRAARFSLIASFDDDSYPLDSDYFAAAVAVMSHSRMAVVGARIIHEGEEIVPPQPRLLRTADFVGCGCVMRREAFLEAGGYVPLEIAYGMEEADLSLRLHDRGWMLASSNLLRVFHATRLVHHASPAVTCASISNLALLSYLRYPPRLWWIGAAQVASRVVWLARHRRFRGILSGLARIPEHVRAHRSYRAPVASKTVLDYLDLRRNPRPL